MAQQLGTDQITKLTSTAAETFTDSYYSALQAARHTAGTFYVPKETMPDGKVVPSIVWNGNVFDDGGDFQKMWQDQMPAYSYFEVQALDCHVLNPTPPPSKEEKEAEARMDESEGAKANRGARGTSREELLVGSLLVVTSGYVRLEEKKEGPMRGFSETFVLVPNRDVGKAREGRRWLIQAQNFRYVV